MNRKQKFFLLATCVVTIFTFHATARADFFSDAVKVVTAPVTLPTQTTINIINGDDPAAPIRGTHQSAGRLIQQGSDQLQKAHDVFMNVPRDAIQANFGSDWRNAYDTITASQRVQFELAMTGGRYIGQCMQGQQCSLQTLVAAPLAAAMRDAYKVYIDQAVPLDGLLAQKLSSVVPSAVLQSSRWTVASTPNFTVPGFLNSGYEAFGHGHAVTLANVIIFSRRPNLSNFDDLVWLVHELYHSEQYRRYGGNSPFEDIDGFAVDYIQGYQDMEDEAERNAISRAQVIWNSPW